MSLSSVFLAVGVLTSAISAAVTITPDNSNIQYYGRFDRSVVLQPKCEWTGSHIKAAFTGTSIAATLVTNTNNDNSKAKVYLDIFIDSVFVRVDSITSTERSMVCATGLANTQHVLNLYVRAEDGILTFKGFTLDNGATLRSLPARPTRRIEFIGDSYTVGYANETTDTGDCNSIAHFTDNYRSWAARAARACNAEYVEIAKSGWGLVRSCWTAAIDIANIRSLYSKTFSGLTGSLWDFSSWKPQVVCIGIGTNDFSNCNPTQSGVRIADTTLFVATYRSFLDTIRSNYPGVTIILNTPPQKNTPLVRCVKQVVASERAAGKSNVYYAQWPWDTVNNMKCSHPTITGDSIAGKVMADSILRIMGAGWGTSSVHPVNRVNVQNKQTLQIRSLGNYRIALSVSGLEQFSGTVKLFNCSGELVQCQNVRSISGTAILQTKTSGIFFATGVIEGVNVSSDFLPVF